MRSSGSIIGGGACGVDTSARDSEALDRTGAGPFPLRSTGCAVKFRMKSDDAARPPMMTGAAGRLVSMVRGARTISFLLLLATLTSAQHAPCYQCEEYERRHPNSQPYTVIRGHCTYPCRCPTEPPQCPDGVPLIMDGCECCSICARQQGDSCDKVQFCDVTRRLECIYPEETAHSGVCKVKEGEHCLVDGVYRKNGETFKLDCRTQCTCQNGTYGCVSLCPNESITPSSRCRNPRLITVREACCREWLCETTEDESKKESSECKVTVGSWSPCSTTCGPGWSFRISNDNEACEMRNESRICEIRPCPPISDQLLVPMLHRHRSRKHHLCRATMKSPLLIRLKDDTNCISVDYYQPRYCGFCAGRTCCKPHLSTTLQIPFRCHTDIVNRNVMWILKCSCPPVC